MAKRWLLVLAAAFVACGGDPTPTGRTCASLGWHCGIDDSGNSCGFCGTGAVCDFGTCVGQTPVRPMCLTAFATCNAGSCCLPAVDGTGTTCTMTASGVTYCAPFCTTTANCDAATGTSGQWVCQRRTDGAFVCTPR